MPAFFTEKLLFFVVLFAAVIGAYCTTIDYRIRMKLPLITKDCFCPFCGHRLAEIYQIPVLSWIVLGGKCRYCRHPIPIRYPLIEAGFIFYYCVTFLLFRNSVSHYAVSWLCFLTFILFIRSQKHWSKLAEGLAVMYAYHALFILVLWAVSETAKLPSAL